MRLGLVTYMWGATWDLPTLLKNCEETGFLGVELRTEHKHGVETTLSADERSEIAKRFADGPVELVGLGTTCEFHSPDPAELARQINRGKEWIKLAHDLGASGIKVRPNGLPNGVAVEKTLAQIGRSLRELATLGADFGIDIRLEVHGKGTPKLANIRTIMEEANHPQAVVCWNCNESDLDDPGLAANFEMVRQRLGTIHIHDLISTYPWRELFKLLGDAKFNGWNLLEEGAATADPVRVMKYYRLLWEEWTKSTT